MQRVEYRKDATTPGHGTRHVSIEQVSHAHYVVRVARISRDGHTWSRDCVHITKASPKAFTRVEADFNRLPK